MITNKDRDRVRHQTTTCKIILVSISTLQAFYVLALVVDSQVLFVIADRHTFAHIFKLQHVNKV